ncbi:terminase large subunit [Paenibacillus apiarius]|uniref:terminase large subunit n=1 Tax=Paenibacillus apiarius TaxID=46240 RepID=UPI003B3A99AB
MNLRSSKLLTTSYAEDAVAGRIIVSKKVRQACRRHLNDLKKQGTDKFPWVFDEERAFRPIEFIELFCKPSKGDFNVLVMQPWQHFIIGSLYGWVHKDTGIRRFKYGLVMVARKNGKSGMASGLATYGSSKDGERGADVYVLANSMKQVRKTIFEECQKMIRASPLLDKHFTVTRDFIKFDKTFSVIEPQASDSEKLDGLNTHLGIFDEIHEYKDFKLINIIKNSTMTRKQPLLFYITTAGYQLDGPLMEYYEKAADVLDGVHSEERFFYFIAELDPEDDIEDSNNWIKANPNLGVTIDLEEMKEEWESAKLIPGERSDFIVKRLNIFVESGEESFLSYEVIKRNNKEIDEKEFEGKQCIGGFDLSDSEDFTSACLEFPIAETGEVFVISHSWIPQKKVEMDNEKIPYVEYKKLGLLTIVPGEYVKKELVYDWFVEQSKLYSIEKITYDPAKAFGLVEALTNYGFATEVVRQGHLTLGSAVDDVKERFIDGNVIFNNNRLFRWYINNVKMVEDRNRNKLPQKQGRYRKIDGFAAFLNAHTEVMKRLVMQQGSGDIEFVSVSDLFRK